MLDDRCVREWYMNKPNVDVLWAKKVCYKLYSMADIKECCHQEVQEVVGSFLCTPKLQDEGLCIKLDMFLRLRCSSMIHYYTNLVDYPISGFPNQCIDDAMKEPEVEYIPTNMVAWCLTAITCNLLIFREHWTGWT